jgi:hypothetical protein
LKISQDELQVVCQQKDIVCNRIEEINEELEKVNRRGLRLKQDLENLGGFITSKLEYLDKLVDRVKDHEKSDFLLLQSVQEAKNELFNSRSFYQEFNVKVISLMMPCAGKLIFRKSIENDHLVEVLYKGKAESIPTRMIEDVFEHPIKENRIVIKYNSKTKDIITEEKQRILIRLREILQRINKP